MNITEWISNNVLNGKEATVSLALLEREFLEPFAEHRIQLWAEGLAKRLGVKVTIHFPSDVVTFYPKVKL